jgi:GNAT superfamily N-acetyltransferase
MRRDKELEKRIQEKVSVNEDDITNLNIILDDERSISHVGIKERELIICGCKTMVGCIGGVATKSDYRERGLATRLMKSAVRQIDEDQGDIMLVSGDRDLYRRGGCVGAAPTYRINVTRTDAEKLGKTRVRLVPYEEKNLLKIIDIYQKEPVRFHRTRDEFKKLLERRTPAPLWTRTDVFTLHDDREILGYIVTQEPRDEKRGKGRVRAISEYAGDRGAVAESISLLFARYDMEELFFFVPEHDAGLLRILKRNGIQCDRRNLSGHTFRIINFPRLMDRFAPYGRERAGEKADSLDFAQEDNKFSITYNQERLELDGKSLVILMFGTNDGAEKNIMIPTIEMSKLMKALFPLPFLWPGLNSF